jgi:type VI secretion system protein ImpA
VAEALFARTRDLRVCAPLVHALTRLHGVAGLAAGLQIIAELLSSQWEQVHPRVSAEYDFDVGYRIRVLMSLADRDGLIRALREALFAEARAVGRFSFRDLEVARGEVPALEGQAVANEDLLRVAIQEGDAAQSQERAQAINAAIQAIDGIEAAFVAATKASGPDLAPLRKILFGAQTFLGGLVADADAGAAAAGGATADGSASGGVGGGQRLESRSDAKRQLDVIAAFLERSEPAHPSAMFVRRAARLLDMDFLEIIKELAPDAVDGVRHLGGIAE